MPSASDAGLPMDELMNQMYDAADPMVQVLYKFRVCNEYSLDALRADGVWFSMPSQLNDPFDCKVRLPTSITVEDIEADRKNLASVEPYDLKIRSPRKVLEFVSASPEMAALTPLGLMASQFGFEQLLKHIRRIDAQDDAWVRDLMLMARELLEWFLQDTTVFCVSEQNHHPLMWAHYAARHAGFCTGYVCPVGIANPRMIFKVAYPKIPPMITYWQLIQDPGAVHQDLIFTKTEPWAYEAEWRIAFRNMPGLLDKLLPYREIIFGAKMSDADEAGVRRAVGIRRVTFYRAVLDDASGTVAIQPA
jgi:Protein of unknown function (DUF2971)